MEQMPQEIMVWSILPAIRRELSKTLVNEHHITQKEVASLLGVTEAAVSQYLKSKRAKDVTFDGKVMKKIRKAAKEIIKDKSALIGEIQKICNSIDVKLMVCDVHKKNSKCVSDNCDICLGGENARI